MDFSLSSSLVGSATLNPDKLALDLQFATDKTLTARKGPTPVFTRASTARFVGSDGLIQSAAINTPRFDHDPVTLACKGLLIEESRTNLCLQSNAFSTSPWANINTVCDVSQNQTGPDGIANSAWTFTDDNAVNSEGRYVTASLTSGVAYSLSVFVKKTTGTPSTYPAIWLARGGVFGGCVINTTAGTATAITVFGAGTIISTTSSVVDFGNFWRVTSFITPTATGTWEISISPSGNGNGTGVMDGTTTGSAVFWGAQLEAGSFPTSYIPTTTASVVRSADVCSITGSAFTSFYNQSEGTFQGNYSFVSGYSNANIAMILVQASNNTFNEIVRIGTPSGLSTQRLDTITGGSLTRITTLNNHSLTALNKVAGAYKAGSNAISLNGGSVVTGSPAGITSLASKLDIGVSHDGSSRINGYIQSLRYYKKRLPNAKLQSLTT